MKIGITLRPMILISIIFCQLAFSNELVIFLGASDLGSNDLKDNYSSKIIDIAKKQKVQLKIITVDTKLPESVKFLPSLYFQNHKGRSLYLGRYTNTEKLEKFIQTKKLIPTKNQTSNIENSITLEKNNFKMFVRLKITDLAGALPTDFDQVKFKREAKSYILSSFNDLKANNNSIQETGDRTIYFDIYPWRGPGNTLAVKIAIYSQFDCHSPIYSSSKALTGQFENMEQVLSSITKDFEVKLKELLEFSKNGDAINFNLSQERVSWKKFGLPLPVKPSGHTDIDLNTLKLSKKWQHTKIESDNMPAAVYFNFPAPLDHYQGHFTKSTSELTLTEGDTETDHKKLSFKDVKGSGTVTIANLDMGNQYLNESAISTINSQEKTAELQFKNVNFLENNTDLRFGEIFPVTGSGFLTMKGKTIPVFLRGDAGLILNEESKPRLFISFKYRVNINSNFEISGPDNSTESNNLIDYNIIMEMEPVL
jgi:hypothetical protein